MAKTIPTTLLLLALAAPAALADTLLIDGIEVDRQSSAQRPRPTGSSGTA